MSKNPDISILGGGPAGLAVAYYFRKNFLSFKLYEASSYVGGNCATLKRGEFLFDTGAHRFHDKDPEITKEIQELLGDELKKVNAPSQIYDRGRFIDFPLSPLNLLKNLGAFTFAKTCFEVVCAKLKKKEICESFEHLALQSYGKIIAKRFLLNYSEKLWGAPCSVLSPDVAGKRIRGLNLAAFIKESIMGRLAKTEHLDGTFYYPRKGYGMIPEKLAEVCGKENICINSKVTRVFHNHSKIQSLEINGKERVEVDRVISTLPLDIFLKMMEPEPPVEIKSVAEKLKYRSLILVGFFLNKEMISENASLYFPDQAYPFTRVYEPKRRSILMAPSGKTSLIAEIPCQESDEIWKQSDRMLIENVRSKFFAIGFMEESEILDTFVLRIHHAYPVLELGYERKIEKIMGYLKNFDNLKFSGRNGKFVYTHLHDMMRFGKDVVEEHIHLTNKVNDKQ